jgi:hypothetical protein
MSIQLTYYYCSSPDVVTRLANIILSIPSLEGAMRMPIWLLGIILVIMLMVSTCQSGQTPAPIEEHNARTYFESLNLQTPEQAVQTFATAFQQEDFMTVYLVLDAEAQWQLRRENAQTFNWKHLVGETASQGFGNDLDIQAIYSTHRDFWYLFDQFMLYAAEKNDLLIDLRGDLEILRSESSELHDTRQAMDVIAAVDGVSGEVLIRMVKDRDNCWRVYMVSAPIEGVVSWPSTSLK